MPQGWGEFGRAPEENLFMSEILHGYALLSQY